ncbi:MAG: 30S ribosomal protein S3 [Patescibacteria group bacterium]
MGQKIHPRGFRLGTVFTWSSRWFGSKREYKTLFLQDVKLRKALFAKLKTAGLAQVDIERSINKIKVTIHVARPGMVIGRGGTGLEDLKKYTEVLLGNVHSSGRLKVDVTVEPVKEPNLRAYLVGMTIADQLAKRMPHKRVANQAIERVMTAGAKGVRILLSGRIAGAEIARRERYQAGTVPLSTIREDVDFATVPALTRSGYVGIKVWICRK